MKKLILIPAVLLSSAIAMAQNSASLWFCKTPDVCGAAPESSVSGLQSDLAGKVSKAGDTMTGVLYNGQLSSPTLLNGSGVENWAPPPQFMGVPPMQPSSQDFFAQPDLRIIDNLDGQKVNWVKASAGSLALDATITNHMASTQSYKFNTDGGGAATVMKWTSISPALDLTNRDFSFWVKVDGFANMTESTLYFSTDNLTSHFFICDWGEAGSGQTYRYIQEGEWTHITVNQGKCTKTGTPVWNSINSIQFRMKDGGVASTTVTLHLSGLASFPEPPKCMISIQQDNANLAVISTMAAYMAGFGMRGTVYDTIENTGLSNFLSIASMTVMKQTYGWEIGLHPGGTFLDTVSTQMVSNLIQNDQAVLLQNGLGNQRGGCVYPHGAFNPNIENVYRQNCDYGRTIINGDSALLDYETWPVADPHRIKAISVSNANTSAQLQTAVKTCIQNPGLLNFLFHDLPSPTVATTDVLPQTFKSFVDFLSTQNATVAPLGELLRTPYHVQTISSMTITQQLMVGGSSTPGSANPFTVISSTGQTILTVKNNGFVGVGNVAPSYMFDVQGGTLNASGPYYSNGQLAFSSAPIVLVTAAQIVNSLASGSTFYVSPGLASGVTLVGISFDPDVGSAGGSGDTFICGDNAGHLGSVVSPNAATTFSSATINVPIAANMAIQCYMTSGAATKPIGNLGIEYKMQ